jgi:hypothetical protein
MSAKNQQNGAFMRLKSISLVFELAISARGNETNFSKWSQRTHNHFPFCEGMGNGLMGGIAILMEIVHSVMYNRWFEIFNTLWLEKNIIYINFNKLIMFIKHNASMCIFVPQVQGSELANRISIGC